MQGPPCFFCGKTGGVCEIRILDYVLVKRGELASLAPGFDDAKRAGDGPEHARHALNLRFPGGELPVNVRQRSCGLT